MALPYIWQANITYTVLSSTAPLHPQGLRITQLYTMMKAMLASLVLVALLCQAAAQPCPSNTCEAAFNGEDCCKWDYNKGPCQWRNTPVSFRLLRRCPDGASVLTKGNSQGQSTASDECKCAGAATKPTPPTPTFNALSICSSMNPKVNMDISGNDIACSGQSFCKVCGGLPAVSDGCMKESRCVAFTFEWATGCGFLKSAPGTSKRMGWVAYVKE